MSETTELTSRRSYSLTVRFPTWTEFWQTDALPDVGDTIARNGGEFLVVAREELAEGAFAVTLGALGPETNRSAEPASA